MAKKLYNKPQLQIVEVKHTDIITTSQLGVYNNESYSTGFLAPERGGIWYDDENNY